MKTIQNEQGERCKNMHQTKFCIFSMGIDEKRLAFYLYILTWYNKEVLFLILK